MKFFFNVFVLYFFGTFIANTPFSSINVSMPMFPFSALSMLNFNATVVVAEE